MNDEQIFTFEVRDGLEDHRVYAWKCHLCGHEGENFDELPKHWVRIGPYPDISFRDAMEPVMQKLVSYWVCAGGKRS